MKKNYFLTILLSIFFYQIVYSQTILIESETYTIDTLANFKVGPGTQYTSLRLQAAKRLDVFFLKVNVTNPYISFKAVLGRDSIYTGEQPSSMAKRKTKEGATYFAGTNGDFYATTGYVGLPIGGTMIEREIATTPNTWKVIAFNETNQPGIGVMSYNGNVKIGGNSVSIHHINHLRADNQLVLYNQHNGKYTRTNAFGTEVLVQLLDGENWGVNKTVKAKVTKIEINKGSMAIPVGYAVLSGHGTAQTALSTLAVNAEVEITLNMLLDGISSSYTNLVGGEGRAPMLKNGVVEQTDVWNEYHPRTGMGYSQDKKTVIYCVVDGRGLSDGVTTKQLAQIMQSAGAYTAFNMDGGGSSCMYVKDFGPMNSNSDGIERSVANGIFAVSSAPTDNVISEIRSYENTIKLPKFGVFKPKFIGYNQYGVLINKDVQGVTLSCEAGLGYINNDGLLVASGTSNGVLTASYNSIQTKVNIVLVEEAQIAIRLDSVLIDGKLEYPIEVQSIIGLNTMNVLSSALSWTVLHPEICSVQNGVLKGLSNGKTKVIGNLGVFKDTITVKVEIPASGRIVQEDFSNAASWNITPPLTTWNTTLTTDGLPNGWSHGAAVRYTYKTTRSPSIRMSKLMPLYSLPDTIKLVLNTGNVEITRLILGLRSNNQTANTALTFNSLQLNKDIEINIPVSQIATNVNDISSYPVWFDYFTLYINSITQVQDVVYNIYLKEIALRYKNISLGINPAKTSSKIHVFPNPFITNELRIHVDNPVTGSLLTKIYNLNGQLIYSQSFENISKDLNIPVASLKTGTYLLRISYENQEESIKIVKH